MVEESVDPPRKFDAPDPMQPIIDENGRVDAEWYRWLLLVAEELNRINDSIEVLRSQQAGRYYRKVWDRGESDGELP